MAKFSAKLVANFRRSLEGYFRASFAGENRKKHFPPKLHRKFHHQTSLRGSGLWRPLNFIKCWQFPISFYKCVPRSAERIWVESLSSSGEFRKLPATFPANSSSEFLALFLQGFTPPPPTTIRAQNSRPKLLGRFFNRMAKFKNDPLQNSFGLSFSDGVGMS